MSASSTAQPRLFHDSSVIIFACVNVMITLRSLAGARLLVELHCPRGGLDHL